MITINVSDIVGYYCISGLSVKTELKINDYLTLLPPSSVVKNSNILFELNSLTREILGLDLMNNNLFPFPRNQGIWGEEEKKFDYIGQQINSVLRFEDTDEEGSPADHMRMVNVQKNKSLFIKALPLYFENPIYGFPLTSLDKKIKHGGYFNGAQDSFMTTGAVQLFYGKGFPTIKVVDNDITKIKKLMVIIENKENDENVGTLYRRFFDACCLPARAEYLINNFEFSSENNAVRTDVVKLLCFFEWFFCEFRDKSARNKHIKKWSEVFLESELSELSEYSITQSLNILNHCRNYLVHESDKAKKKLMTSVDKIKEIKDVFEKDKVPEYNRMRYVYPFVFQECITLAKKITRQCLQNNNNYAKFLRYKTR